ncbi:magnesium transporter [Bacillus mesophilus]|uniref:Magnesium transport protein CorA n=1 Tax=Bacillus mesophilus TaxID=1808955 RepID=A0A6M0QCB0_9BACI|nr:magnesium/cobalt transporter CorA [Bacillus mesophilus]MBM7661912.1 magnesium transporter [Bacillus mesophilus]NEY72728.1 magnesium/cobalt transporter CorA [Bacillus mesophilus]
MLQSFLIKQNGEKEIGKSIPPDPTMYQWMWIDLTDPTDAEVQTLTKTFSFHPLAIEDCINHTIQRPKLDYYHDHTFFIVHALNQNLKKDELSIFIGENYIVTFHYRDLQEINQVWNKLISVASHNINKWNHYVVFHHLLDKAVDNYFPILYELEDALDELGEKRRVDSNEKQLDLLFNIKSQLISLRHTINPMRDLLYRVLNSHKLDEVIERKEYFSDIYDHLLKLSEMVDSNREITNDLRDSYLSLTAHQQNKIMQTLTVITTIFMPLTFIAGIYGMNFDYMPELKWDIGYFLILSLMATIGCSMYLWFKRRGWFK